MKRGKFICVFGVLGMTLCMLLGLTACGGSSAGSTGDSAGAEQTVAVEEDHATPNKTAELKYGDLYSEGRAWVMFGENETTYWGVIDKSGNAIVRFNAATGIQYTPYYEGYSHVKTANGYYILDKEGNIVRQFNVDEGTEVILAKGGYVATKTDMSGFDAVGYQYTIYNPDGSVLTEFSEESEHIVAYYGKGVFSVDSKGYYCSQSGSWVEEEVYLPVFCDDTAVIATTYYEVDDSLYGDRFGGIVTLSTTGETNTIFSKYIGNNISPSVIVDDICVLYDFWSDSDLTALNISTLEEYPLPEEYASKMWDMEEEIYSPYDNRIVVHMKGADGNGYVCVFDTQMNLVFGPVQGFANAYSDGRMVLESSDDDDTLVYDTEGNIIFSLAEKGYMLTDFPAYGRYSDGALFVHELLTSPSQDYAYLDTDGNRLFEQINLDNVKTIEP